MKHIGQKNHRDCLGAVVAMLMGDPAYHIRYEDEVKPLSTFSLSVIQRKWLSAIKQVAWIDLDASYRDRNKSLNLRTLESLGLNPCFELPSGRGVILIWGSRSSHIAAFENGMVYDSSKTCEMSAVEWYTEMKKQWDYFDVQPEPKHESL